MNKSTVWALGASGGVLLLAGIIVGMKINESGSVPAASSQLEPSEKKLAEYAADIARKAAENARKAAADFQRTAIRRAEELDRLVILDSHSKLYDVEKDEIREIMERIEKDFPEIRPAYHPETGRIDSLAEWVKRIKNSDHDKLLILQTQAVELAKAAAEKQLECIKYAEK